MFHQKSNRYELLLVFDGAAKINIFPKLKIIFLMINNFLMKISNELSIDLKTIVLFVNRKEETVHLIIKSV